MDTNQITKTINIKYNHKFLNFDNIFLILLFISFLTLLTCAFAMGLMDQLSTVFEDEVLGVCPRAKWFEFRPQNNMCEKNDEQKVTCIFKAAWFQTHMYNNDDTLPSRVGSAGSSWLYSTNHGRTFVTWQMLCITSHIDSTGLGEESFSMDVSRRWMWSTVSSR